MTTTTEASPPVSAADAAASLRHGVRWGERTVLSLLWLCAAVSILTTVGIVVILFEEAWQLFSEDVNLWGFLTGTTWQPVRETYGVVPLVAGTLMITGIALLVAVPLGIATAIYLSSYAPSRVRRTLKPVLEILAGVPTVVLGYFALTFVTPVLRGILGDGVVMIFNNASAGIVVGIMIVPTIASLAEDAMSAVPRELREGSLGLGASQRQTVLKVVMPAALSGIVAAVILGMGRAIGETMVVAIAAGALPVLNWNPFEPMQPMTSYIVQTFGGEAPRGTPAYESLFAVGALLFLMTLGLNLLAGAFVRRYRERY
jgi:phosphate transport system permease protein